MRRVRFPGHFCMFCSSNILCIARQCIFAACKDCPIEVDEASNGKIWPFQTKSYVLHACANFCRIWIDMNVPSME